MKVITARDAKKRFGEFLDASQREPVVITKSGRPVGIMISIEDAFDTVFPEMLLDQEHGYDGWLFEKVVRTTKRVEAGGTELIEHSEAVKRVRERIKARFSEQTA